MKSLLKLNQKAIDLQKNAGRRASRSTVGRTDAQTDIQTQKRVYSFEGQDQGERQKETPDKTEVMS